MAEQFKMINLAIELSGFVLCLLGSMLAAVNSTLNQRTKRYFVLSFACLMAETVCNLAGQFMRGLPGSLYRMALYVSNFGEFLFAFILPFIGTRLLLTIIDKDRAWEKINRILWVYLFVTTLLLILSQFTGLFYFIDSNNVYRRSNTFFVSFLLGESMLLLDVIVIIRYRSLISKRAALAFGIYFVVPFIATVVQFFFYGIYITLFSEIFSALTLFIFILIEQTDQYYLKEQEIKEMRMAVMMSQIQPHFLYNTLSTIQALCRINPEKAFDITEKFGVYLRQNIDSLSQPDLIPFSKELEHTRIYAEIEMIRFPNIRIEYDIQDDSFKVPALTVQPLVENAIRHGVRIRKNGSVTVRTRTDAACHEIAIFDNGKGFNLQDAELLGDAHIGIRNVRERIEKRCGGTLNIDSRIDEGTRITIRIPIS